ncbi:unnamed protein product [Clavelina lepadiformis]|uniref:CTP synthase N-terminal domain-containing protein n=1 Tax=Clavelina lepadiformis TaxID=159417 RepID=A0ABP0EZH5_CLALP
MKWTNWKQANCFIAERVSKIPVNGVKEEPQVCIIELGGTIGDIEGMPFVEAFRQFQFRVKPENFCNIHVSLVPQPSTTGEQKTKPTQHSVRQLRGLGLSPDLIICRSYSPIHTSVKEKISNFCHVAPEQVITVHDAHSIYHVPFLLDEQNISSYFMTRLGLPGKLKRSVINQWKNLADLTDRIHTTVNIALVGKYTQLEDSYASVIKALRHSALAVHKKLNLTKPNTWKTKRLPNSLLSIMKHERNYVCLMVSLFLAVLVPVVLKAKSRQLSGLDFTENLSLVFVLVCKLPRLNLLVMFSTWKEQTQRKMIQTPRILLSSTCLNTTEEMRPP